MSNTIGEKLKITVFGQSHAEAVGAVVDGLPAGFAPDMEKVRAFMARRAPGGRAYATARRETDEPRILSGLADGVTCGAPVCAVIENADARSGDYARYKNLPRPGHADFTAWVKYGGYNDVRGGGQFSGRLTAPLCFAGALCLQLLERRGVFIAAQILEIAGVEDEALDPAIVTPEQLAALSSREFPVVAPEAGARMREAIERAKAEGDSVGGVIRCYALGLPAGLGEPMFGGVENRLAAAIFGIPAVRGVAFGAGFRAARMRGSEHNDAFSTDGKAVFTLTNRHGGVLGGITTGMPLVMDTAIKPTPSIGLEQRSVDLLEMKNAPVTVTGRHDPCIVPRALPVVEAVTALTLLDMML